MEHRRYLISFAGIAALVAGLIVFANLWIDPLGNHSLPNEGGPLPRSTHHSPLSKLHYLYSVNPEVVYFGNSRVVVGLPPDARLFGGRTVYNAALAGATFGEFALLARHALAVGSPTTLIMGLDFPSFQLRRGDSGMVQGVVSASRIEYSLRRFPIDLKEALSGTELRHSLQSAQAYFRGTSYDPNEPSGERSSFLGKTTDTFMERITRARGLAQRAFQIKVRLAFLERLPEGAEIAAALGVLDQILDEACRRNVVVRLYINPVHALAEDAVRVRGQWPRLEGWKALLTERSDKLAARCDLRLLDFSGYNSVTTEGPVGLDPDRNLKNYWEASHYKTAVGELILRKLIAPGPMAPVDFGRELRGETLSDVLSAIRVEQSAYLGSHAREIEQAQQWGLRQPNR